MGELINAATLLVVDKATGVVCRECDLPMKFEGENPAGYFLYKCATSTCVGGRVGLLVKGLDKILDGLLGPN